jgi:hypothetical protein
MFIEAVRGERDVDEIGSQRVVGFEDVVGDSALEAKRAAQSFLRDPRNHSRSRVPLRGRGERDATRARACRASSPPRRRSRERKSIQTLWPFSASWWSRVYTGMA